jgi:very-short-patch-repair endonuclease
MTLPEVLLWQQLRGRKSGLKFRRQHPIEPYVVDFYCREAGLVVEIDGGMHDSSERSLSDQKRDAFLKARGLQILRINASDVLGDPAAVAQSITEWVGSPLHQPAAGPPPRERGGTVR